MHQSKSSVKRIPRRIAKMLAFSGISAIGVMIVMVIWMTNAMDELAHEYARDLISASTQEETDKVVSATHDQARWWLGDRWRVSPNALALYGTIGAAAESSANIDLTYVFGQNDRILHVFEDMPSNFSARADAIEIAKPFVDLVRENRARFGHVASGYARLGDHLVYVAATRMSPENRDDFSLDQLPIMANIMVFTPEVLTGIKRGQLGTSLIVDFESVDRSSEILLPLLSGGYLAYLRWTSPAYGREVLNRSIGFVVGFLLLVGLVHLYVGYIVQRLTSAFLRESKGARTDGLTGLLNRTGFDEAMQSERILKAVKKGHLGVIIIDMDKFKPINDTYGHHVGDLALKTIARRLQDSARPVDLVARLGGDEFAAIVIDPSARHFVQQLMDRFTQANTVPIDVDGDRLTLTASMGFALSKDAGDLRQTMMAADASMYASKTARAYGQDTAGEAA